MANWTNGIMSLEGYTKDLKNFKKELDRLQKEEDFVYAITNFDDNKEEWDKIDEYNDDDIITLWFYGVECRWSFSSVEMYAKEAGQKTLEEQSKDFNLEINYKGYEVGCMFIENCKYINGGSYYKSNDYDFHYNNEKKEWEIKCDDRYAYDILEGELEWYNSEYPDGEVD